MGKKCFLWENGDKNEEKKLCIRIKLSVWFDSVGEVSGLTDKHKGR